MSDTISDSIGDPTDADPDFPTDPATALPETPEGEDGDEGAGTEESETPTS